MELFIWVAFAILAFVIEKVLTRKPDKSGERNIPPVLRDVLGLPDDEDERYRDYYEQEEVRRVKYEQVPEYARPVPERYKYVEPQSLEDDLVGLESPHPGFESGYRVVESGHLSLGPAATVGKGQQEDWSAVAPPLQTTAMSAKSSRPSKPLARLNSGNIRDAILLTEILGKPKGAA